MKRYWAFSDLKFKYEGYNPAEIYRAVWQGLTDRSYFVFESKYIHVIVGDVRAAVSWLVAIKEVEKKYTLTGIRVFMKMVWRQVPKPGTSGENAPKIPFGKAEVTLNGYVSTDYLNIWGGSPLLAPFVNLRERLFYKNRREVFKNEVRQDAEGIIQDLKELISFLPKLM